MKVKYHPIVQILFDTKSLFLFLVLILSITACSREDDQIYISDLGNKDNAGGIEFAGSESIKKLEINSQQFREGGVSEMIRIDEVIYLDNSVPIGKVDKLLFYQDKLCVFDKKITNTLHLFDRSGKHLQTIGTKGEGPGEYRQIHDVQINPYTNLIDIWDGNGQKVMSFDENGQLISERRVDIFASTFAVVDTSVYLFYQGNGALEPGLEFKMIAVNADNQEVYAKLFPLRPGEASFSVMDPGIILNTSPLTSKSYFTRLFDDHIYTLKDHQIVPEYYVDFKGKTVSFKDVNFNQDKNKIVSDWLLNPNYLTMVGPPVETNDHLFFTFNQGTMPLFAFYHKKTENTHVYKLLRNDITGTAAPFPLSVDRQSRVYFTDEAGIYFETVRRGAEFRNISEAEYLEKWKKDHPFGYSIYNRISEFDNPILLVGEFIFE